MASPVSIGERITSLQTALHTATTSLLSGIDSGPAATADALTQLGTQLKSWAGEADELFRVAPKLGSENGAGELQHGIRSALTDIAYPGVPGAALRTASGILEARAGLAGLAAAIHI